MLDIEGELPIPDNSLKALVGSWIQECHNYYGYYPVLYLSPYSLYIRLMGTPNLRKCPLWSGIMAPHWDIIPFYTAEIVQFKIDKVDGFEGGVDCNHLNGALEELMMKEWHFPQENTFIGWIVKLSHTKEAQKRVSFYFLVIELKFSKLPYKREKKFPTQRY